MLRRGRRRDCDGHMSQPNPFKRPCEKRHPAADDPTCLWCAKARNPDDPHAKLWAMKEAPPGTVTRKLDGRPVQRPPAYVPCRWEGDILEHCPCGHPHKHVRHCMNDDQDDGRCTRITLGGEVPGCDRCSLREPVPEVAG